MVYWLSFEHQYQIIFNKPYKLISSDYNTAIDYVVTMLPRFFPSIVKRHYTKSDSIEDYLL